MDLPNLRESRATTCNHELIISCVGGRNLKSHDKKAIGDAVSLKVDHHHHMPSPYFAKQEEGVSKAEELDDFRPTKPGHSPGVGHAINN
ncbi:hypothetical protein SAY86_032233 [Trapa natans]|uniref:Uncharacterized protein n=1 Tax=Trapa natans TaxID=22666 RepID=A0AAN7LT75_TRANT|nr:hypothetical protein SAY86_032233 [Trapa natans]